MLLNHHFKEWIKREDITVEMWISGLGNQVEAYLKTQSKNIKRWKSWSRRKEAKKTDTKDIRYE